MGLLVSVLVVAPAPARADGGVHLGYRLGPGAAGCPGNCHLSHPVMRRLGHDPFAAGGQRRLEVRLAAGGAKDTVTLTLRDAGGR